MKKKKQKIVQQQLSPIEYIKTKVRTLPIYKCYINSDWLEWGITTLMVSRIHPAGSFTFANFLIDTYTLGFTKTLVMFNVPQKAISDMLETFVSKKSESQMIVEIDYVLAHNIIYGAVNFNKEMGYKIPKDFELTKYILQDNNDKVDHIDIVFGREERDERLERFAKELDKMKQNTL